MGSIPRLDSDAERRLMSIEGQPPDLAQLPPGCAFQPRCRIATDVCHKSRPPLVAIGDRHSKACFHDVTA
jgi:oligopeptide transport system ATP-binding protein